ncbi:uncharacterized protein C8Q71DRAFT_742955, partial [Rhodofomes roseus]
MSIMRANHVAFPISPRNSPLAVARLINKAGVSHVLVGREQAMQDLVNEALAILTTRYRRSHLCRSLKTYSFLRQLGRLSRPPMYTKVLMLSRWFCILPAPLPSQSQSYGRTTASVNCVYVVGCHV